MIPTGAQPAVEPAWASGAPLSAAGTGACWRFRWNASCPPAGLMAQLSFRSERISSRLSILRATFFGRVTYDLAVHRMGKRRMSVMGRY